VFYYKEMIFNNMNINMHILILFIKTKIAFFMFISTNFAFFFLHSESERSYG